MDLDYRRTSSSTASGGSSFSASPGRDPYDMDMPHHPLQTPLVPYVPIPHLTPHLTTSLGLVSHANKQLSLPHNHHSSHSAPASIPRKRKPHTRTKTGCRRCRQQRVKCPEGPVGPTGRQVICRRCWETDRQCYYPSKGSRPRSDRNSEEAWERAEDVDEWRWGSGVASGGGGGGSGGGGGGGSGAASKVGEGAAAGSSFMPQQQPIQSSHSLHHGANGNGQGNGNSDSNSNSHGNLNPNLSAFGSLGQALIDTAPREGFDWAALFQPAAPPQQHQAQASILLLDDDDEHRPHQQHQQQQLQQQPLHARENQNLLSLVGAGAFSPSSARVALPSAPETAPTSISPGFLNSLLSPSPLTGVVTPMTLASLSTSQNDRLIVNYFEVEGCNEIVSTTKSKHNWIFMELFPRLLATLGVQPGSPTDDAHGAVRQWLHFCLLHIAYVHRANIEPDEVKSSHFRSEAKRFRQKASYAILRAKVKWPDGQWKSEEYLMGFFVRCMADMLDSGDLVLDRHTAFELPLESTTPFYTSLRDMIALYSTLQFACTSIDKQVGTVAPLFEMPSRGEEWVERFVGFSRRIVRIIGRVNGMVMYRAGLIRAGTDLGGPGKLLRAEAERLASELGESWAWDENAQEIGQSSRVQRGDEVMRHALLVLLLCEVLNVSLDDPRITSACNRAIELVCDCEPAAVGGFQWALTILAIYCDDLERRDRIQQLIHQVIALSFGSGYRGPDDILMLCWEALEQNGTYDHGIAPWRDAMSALGRNLFI